MEGGDLAFDKKECKLKIKGKESMHEKVAHLQKREEELKEEIKELKTESKEQKLETKERQSNIGEGAITLGPWGGNRGGYWAYKLEVVPIMQMTLGYGSVIDSILITSKRRDSNIIGCSDRFGGPSGEYATV
ncbi:hypothetical protein RHGRI_033442 [Rhododendron griersonianum]|uniref:Uncharacterized protein n=1 Tax=Rhododendron griersonianum TaxID=479676 RepID=A0AAV6HWR0_9ERIC|nr:hypothetical protein RHGRI_033442 [Rhododendron griersonianum]